MTNFNHLFEISAKKYENNVAIIKFHNDSYETYTYKELQETSQVLYKEVQKKFSTEEIIGIYCTHNVLIPMLINVIHKCNSAFAFLNTNADKMEIETILSDMKITQIFAVDECLKFDSFLAINLSEFVENFNCKLFLYTNTCNNKISQKIAENNVAYFIKTSGSTGIAKYVLVSHGSIFPNIEDLENILNVNSNDVIYFSTPLTFDPSMIELYLSIKCGASLLLSSPSLTNIFNKKHSATIWQTTPSLFMRYGITEIKNVILSQQSSLRILALGGEPLCFDFYKLKSENNCTRIFSLYGITEISCWASIKEICNSEDEMNNRADVGRILSETFLEIRNNNNQRRINEIGNIFIGSNTRICLVGPECSNYFSSIKSFFNVPQTIWYNSGDLGMEKNGIIYFNGRSDRLVKRFGHKINLLEIEKTILKSNFVEQCICLWNAVNQFLVILFTSSNNITNNLWKYLHSNLNRYSLPDNLLQVDILPTNDHGKISLLKCQELCSSLIKDATPNKNWVSLFLSLLSKYSLCEKDVNEITNKSFMNIGGTSIGAVQLINEFELKTEYKIPDLYIQLLDKDCTLNFVMEFIQEKEITKSKCIKNNVMPTNSNKRNTDFITNIPFKKVSAIDKKIEIIWKFDTGKCVDARVILHKNNNEAFVLIGSHSGIAAVLNASSGKPHFLMNFNSRIEAPFYCFECRGDSYAVVGCYDGSFWCISIKDSKVVWKIMLNSMIKSQACHIDSCIFVGTYDSIINTIDINTGEVTFSTQISKKGIASDLLCYEKYVFVGTLDGMCACTYYDAKSLNVIWRNKLESPIFAKPLLVKNRQYVLFAEVNKKIHCFCTKTGESFWIFDNIQGNIFSSCSLLTTNDDEFIIFGCHDRHTYKLSFKSTKNPTVDWKIPHSSEIYSTPYVRNDLSVISISTNGHLLLISEDGQIVGEHQFPGEVFSSPIAHENNIYVGCRDDNVYCLKIV